jgi:mRNA-degrading endonuclease YafQ of YafQ-DinJ toxin-antitoxin module
MRSPRYAVQFKRDVKKLEILIYSIDDEYIRFDRTGAHADLFGK